MPTPNKDYIFYERETSRWHQEHIVLHEACHMLWGHEPTPITAPELAQLLVPSISPATVRLMLQRRAYPEEQEHEAELLATLILERVGGIGSIRCSKATLRAERSGRASRSHPRRWQREKP